MLDWTKRAWNEKGMNPSERLVYLKLADWAGADRWTNETLLETIAELVELTERQVRRIIENLQASGRLIVQTIKRGVFKFFVEFVTPMSQSSGHTRHKLVTPVSQQNDMGVTPFLYKQELKQELNSSSARDPEPVTAAAANSKTDEDSFNAKLVAIFESSFGLLPSLFQTNTLAEYANTYTIAWLEDALKEAALSGVRTLKYVRSILERWQREGRGMPRPGTVPAKVSAATKPADPDIPEWQREGFDSLAEWFYQGYVIHLTQAGYAKKHGAAEMGKEAWRLAHERVARDAAETAGAAS